VQAAPAAEGVLVARAREGDARAYEELVEQHQATAFRVAWLITRSAPDAEEAAQDGFVKAYAALGRFRAGAPFRPWLLKIVANEARNRRVAVSRRQRLTLKAIEERPREGGPAAEAEAIASSGRAELLAAIARLGRRDQLVIAARFLLELSEEETAAALGLRRGTVKSRTSRALARLRKEVEADA
jgi:RNA polymerase sigma-70 factor (ECF subfamily)